MIEKSDQINELSAALAKAQAAMSFAKKDSANPFFKSNYADLASVWDACRKPLTDNDLSIVQLPEMSESGLCMRTMLLHSSGQYISSVFNMPLVKNDPQSYGSAMTYARRYSLAAITGVYQDDDDANNATGKDKPQNQPQAQAKPQTVAKPTPITDVLMKRLMAVATECGFTDAHIKNHIKTTYNLDSKKALTVEQADATIKAMQQAVKK
jgi:hypothetical protein